MVTVCFTLHDRCKALALIALENQSLTPKLEKNAVKKVSGPKNQNRRVNSQYDDGIDIYSRYMQAPRL